MKEIIKETSSLRWLANMFPFTEGAEEETDKMSNAINVYCTAGADKIDELNNKVEELKDIIKVLEYQLKGKERRD